MRKIFSSSLVIAIIVLSGFRVDAQQTYVAEKVVAVVGNSVVLLSELEDTKRAMAEERRRQGEISYRDADCEALELNMMRKMLARQAELDSIYVRAQGVNDAVEEQADELIREHGSLRAVEAIFHKPMYTIKDDLRERYMEIQKAISMENTIKNKTTVTPADIDRFYRQVNKDSLPTIPDQYTYSQILLYPSSTDEAKFRTRQKLQDLRQRIINGERFSTLARAYSVDRATAVSGGEMDWSKKEVFEKPFADALEKLLVGQISDVVETVYGFHIIELVDFRNGQYKARHILMRPEFTTAELEETVNKLDSVRTSIVDGEISFPDAAVKYSDDKMSSIQGGKVSNNALLERYMLDSKQASRKFYREELGEDYAPMRNLKPGDISEPFITKDSRGNDVVKIIRLDEHIAPHRANIKDDYNFIEEIALEIKKEEEYSKWIQKKIGDMYIRIDEKYRGCDFEYSGWVK